MTFDPDAIAKRAQEQAQPRTEAPIDPKIFDNYVGYYLLVGQVFTVTREGDQFFTQLPSQPRVQIYPESSTKFFAKVVHAQISFITDPQGRANALILHQGGLEQTAKRIDKAEADRIAEQLAKRMKDGIAQQGSEAALRHTIESLQAAQPNYDEMMPSLAELTRRQLPNLKRALEELGQLQSISFRGVGGGGFDIYEVRFTNGLAIWRIFMTPEGKISGLLLQTGP